MSMYKFKFENFRYGWTGLEFLLLKEKKEGEYCIYCGSSAHIHLNSCRVVVLKTLEDRKNRLQIIKDDIVYLPKNERGIYYDEISEIEEKQIPCIKMLLDLLNIKGDRGEKEILTDEEIDKIMDVFNIYY